jgi:hypothetical protein
VAAANCVARIAEAAEASAASALPPLKPNHPTHSMAALTAVIVSSSGGAVERRSAAGIRSGPAATSAETPAVVWTTMPLVAMISSLAFTARETRSRDPDGRFCVGDRGPWRFEALRTSGLTVLVGSARFFVGTGYVVRGHHFRIHDPVKFGGRNIVELQCRLLGPSGSAAAFAMAMRPVAVATAIGVRSVEFNIWRRFMGDLG